LSLLLAVEAPGWLRATHALSILFLTLVARSGVEILSSFPKLYGSDHCTPGSELLQLTRRPLPEGRLWTGLEEEESWSPWLALPGRTNLGLGRHWHFASVLAWITTGLTYIVLLLASGEWRRLVPTSLAVFSDAWTTVVAYLSLELPPPGDPYNGAQQLAYFGVVFGLAPLAIATGAAMSPAVAGRFPRFLSLFGGRQRARTLHFGCLIAFVGFTCVHTALVVVHGLPEGLAAILLGSTESSHRDAILLGVLGLAVIVAVNLAATAGSLGRPVLVRRLLDAIGEPVQRLLARTLASQQRGYTTADISPYLRINGYPPAGDDYAAMISNGFRAWRLDVGGLVERPLSLDLDELRALERVELITKHNCIQGWSGVAAWAGVPLAQVLELCGVRPAARFVVFRALDDKAETGVGAEPREGRFYGSILLEVALQPQSILAYEFNGLPLPPERGAPLRLRLENQLGFKMVKWIDRIELVADLREIGRGRGGWKEDHVHFGSTAAV